MPSHASRLRSGTMALLLLAGAAGTACTRPVAAPPPALRAESGGFSLLRHDTGQYLPVTVPADLAVDAAVLTGSGSANVVRLPGGGSIRLGSATAVAVGQVARQGDRLHVQLQVDQGRVWAQPQPGEEVTLASFNCQVRATAAAVEDNVFEDASHFKNTVVKVWSGRAHVNGGPELKSSCELTYGMSIHADDAGMNPAAPFDDTRPDAWEQWNQSWSTVEPHAGS